MDGGSRAARVIHPFPTGLNVAATAALACIAVGGVPAASELARLTAAMFCVQAAIGASNDYFDRDLDRVTKPYKPIARGLIASHTALVLAALLALAAGVLTATFGPLAIAAGAVGLAAGLAYNARLKAQRVEPAAVHGRAAGVPLLALGLARCVPSGVVMATTVRSVHRAGGAPFEHRARPGAG